jgi:hypothetical protein
MTLSASVGRRRTIAKTIELALKSAGLKEASQSPSPAEYGLGRELLENITDALQNDGVFARVVKFYDQLLVPDTYIYTMPSWVEEVAGTAMYIDPTQPTDAADGETPVYQISREEWQTLGNKGSSARVTKYFTDRNEDLQKVYLWQVPNEAATIRFQVVRFLADTDDGAATLDLQPFWNMYLQYALASAFREANGLPPGQHEAKARDQLEKCVSTANEGTSNQMVVEHGPSCDWRMR